MLLLNLLMTSALGIVIFLDEVTRGRYNIRLKPITNKKISVNVRLLVLTKLKYFISVQLINARLK